MHFELSYILLLLATTGVAFLLPNPPGKYNVTLTTGTLTDYNRDARELMLSVFQPSTCVSTEPVMYIPNNTAGNQGPWIQETFNISVSLSPVFLAARQPVCLDHSSRCTALDDTPVVLLDPGYRASRLYFNFIASAIASEGFTVITTDHPGETSVITYPDGHAVYANLPSIHVGEDLAAALTPLAYVRAADVSFIIDQLVNNSTAMFNLLPRQVPVDRVVAVGHSLGGASVTLATGQDSRICGVVNWDGPIFGDLPASGLSQPVLYVTTERAQDPWFTAAWPKFVGPKLWINVTDLQHQGMADFPTLFQAAGQDATSLADVLGTIAPTESVRILKDYTTEWIKGAFEGHMGGPLLQGEELDKYPEVSVFAKENF